MCDRYSCIFYLIPTKFLLKTLLKHLNIHFLTPDFSKQNGVHYKLLNLITTSQCHIHTLDDMRLYAPCNALILHETRFFHNKQVQLCIKIGITIFKMFIWGGISKDIRCSKGSILQYFRPLFSYHLSSRPFLSRFTHYE